MGTKLIMEGKVMDVTGKPIPGVILSIWNADSEGNYSWKDDTFRG
jgi:protocatechuate 3,4-dioxygenase beta subunit